MDRTLAIPISWVNSTGSIPDERNQFDIVEANALLHLPLLFEGGVDIKAGQYSTPLGYEVIDPSTNPFYSHSYIFNFGLPLKHTGVLTTSHVSSLLDVYLGVDTGSNTTFGPLGENNSAIAFIGGVNLTLMDGNLTILALTHIGPENASRALVTRPASTPMATIATSMMLSSPTRLRLN